MSRHMFLWGMCLLSMSLMSFVAPATVQLQIVSPHRQSVQQEFVQLFEKYYQETFKEPIKVSWVTQGGASGDLKFVLSRFDKSPATSGVDIFWGGGEGPHIDLGSRGLLTPYKLSPTLQTQIPAKASGVALHATDHTWHASAVSSFGLFTNKTLLKMRKLPDPKSWEDLADAKFLDLVSHSDPRHSSTSATMNYVIVQAYGWEKAWDILTRSSANIRKFYQSSSDPVKAVVSGEATVAPVVDYFAQSKIADLGTDKLGFVLPAGKTIINSDPISILKGAPNRLAAERFVEWILSADVQKILILPKGSTGGPKYSTLGRMAVNKVVYQDPRIIQLGKDGQIAANPFALNFSSFVIDLDQATKQLFVLNDLVGATLIDSQKELKLAWKKLISAGLPAEGVRLFSAPIISQRELEALVPKWNNQKLRNETMNQWQKTAKEKYSRIAQGQFKS